MEATSRKQQLIKQLLTTNNFTANLADVAQVISELQLSPNYPSILVAGTNGKGSTCAYLSQILSLAGYRVGTFTSPHVFDYNERITINNQPISDEDLTSDLSIVMAASAVNLGLFKSFTLAAHHYFMRRGIEIAIIEVGVGGGRDVTNLFEPELAVLTTVGLDHCEILGDSLEAIGLEKAQIFRQNKPALIGDPKIPQVVLDYAQQIGAQLNLAKRDYWINAQPISWDFHSAEFTLYGLPLPALRGAEQLNNAALALAALGKLRHRFPVTSNQIKTALLQVALLGRFQVLAGTPQIVLDTAHNPQAVETMLHNMVKLPFAKQNLAIFAVAEDKDWRQILRLAQPYFERWFLAPLANSRSSSPDELRDYLLELGVARAAIKICGGIAEATQQAYRELGAEDRVVAFGSFLVVETALHVIKEVRK